MSHSCRGGWKRQEETCAKLELAHKALWCCFTRSCLFKPSRPSLIEAIRMQISDVQATPLDRIAPELLKLVTYSWLVAIHTHARPEAVQPFCFGRCRRCPPPPPQLSLLAVFPACSANGLWMCLCFQASVLQVDRGVHHADCSTQKRGGPWLQIHKEIWNRGGTST